jgi:vacuolar-type H+-ATPase subunit H|tara:strand:- start:859 stop:1059 length:201 start_codon:yes stop_codon:yes gene_type:complete
MSKDIEKAIKDAHDAADKAIDEVQEEIQETRMEVLAWLKQTRSFTYAELLVVALGVVVAVATIGNI